MFGRRRRTRDLAAEVRAIEQEATNGRLRVGDSGVFAGAVRPGDRGGEGRGHLAP
jgi:hypothetical protein